MKLFESMNEHAVPMGHYLCNTCGAYFTVCPAPDDDNDWKSCLSIECASYNPSRDVDWLFVDD